jgi:hypothetical protein
MKRMLLIPVLAFLAVGCGGGPVQTMPPGMGSITLGTTALDGSGFVPLEGDQPLVPGAQGGFHIWLKYRVKGMAPGKVMVKRPARRVSDDRLLLTTMGAQEVGEASADGTWELPNAIPSFMCPAPLGVKVFDEPVVFDVVITTEDGTVLGEGTAEATPRCEPGAQQPFCEKICTG